MPGEGDGESEKDGEGGKNLKFAILQSLQSAQKSPGEPGRMKVIPKINRQMDF